MYSGTNESDQIVRLVLSGSVFFLKVSGQASVELLKFISAAASEESKASGKVRLKSLLQSGSELKVFTLQGDERFNAFKDAAKDYGVKYSVVKRHGDDKEAGIYDIMVKAEDASKINRIIEKYSLVEIAASVTATNGDDRAQAEGQNNQNRTNDAVQNDQVNDQKHKQKKSQFDSVADIRDVLGKMLQPAVQVNPVEASEGSEFQSGAYSMNDRRMYQPDKERKSVIKELEENAKKAEEERSTERSNTMDEDAILNFMRGLMQPDDEDERDKSKESVVQ